MVMDGGVNGDEFLQTSHTAKALHRPFSSPKRLVRILAAVVQPATCLLAICIADDLHRGAVGPQQIDYDDMWRAKALHGFSEKLQCRFTVTALRHIAFKHFAFVINCTPEVVRLTIDLHEDFVQVPLPI